MFAFAKAFLRPTTTKFESSRGSLPCETEILFKTARNPPSNSPPCEAGGAAAPVRIRKKSKPEPGDVMVNLTRDEESKPGAVFVDLTGD